MLYALCSTHYAACLTLCALCLMPYAYCCRCLPETTRQSLCLRAYARAALESHAEPIGTHGRSDKLNAQPTVESLHYWLIWAWQTELSGTRPARACGKAMPESRAEPIGTRGRSDKPNIRPELISRLHGLKRKEPK